MFQFAGFASPAYGFSRRYRRSGGLPHSEIHGSKPARGSPWLIATCCVLHRLSVPRHPPDALQTLDLNSTNAPRAGESPQGTCHQPAPHPAKMHHMTQPAVVLLQGDGPAGSSSVTNSSHVKDPIPAHARISAFSLIGYHGPGHPRSLSVPLALPPGGGRRDRTDDLMLAKHALSQLSYGPSGGGLKRRRRPPSPWLSRHRARRPVDLASALAGFGRVNV